MNKIDELDKRKLRLHRQASSCTKNDISGMQHCMHELETPSRDELELGLSIVGGTAEYHLCSAGEGRRIEKAAKSKASKKTTKK